MKVKFALDTLEKSIFLAGPTPRSAEVASWRPKALSILDTLGFDGTVFVPESSDWGFKGDYNGQVHWEWEALNQATVVAFWVPRDLEHLPGFTTNVEFGLLATSGKVLLGAPSEAVKLNYLEALAKRYDIGVFRSFHSLLSEAVKKTKNGFSP